jgi:hypothetical protein
VSSEKAGYECVRVSVSIMITAERTRSLASSDGEVSDWHLSERHFSRDDIKLMLSLVFGLVGGSNAARKSSK